MRAAKFILLSLIAGSSMLPSTALAGGWQQHRNNAPLPPRAGAPATNPNPGGAAGSKNNFGNYQWRLNGPGPHRGDWLRKYGTLPAPQQEQQLRQDPNFRSLPPDQQQKLIDRLHTFDSLTPDSKAKILNRMEFYEHLSPSQQQAAQGLFQRYKALPEDRRGKVSQAYHQLRDLPADQRAQLLNSDEYRNSFSDEERDLLRGMTALTSNRND